MSGVGLVWDLLAKDGASPAFLKVAGAADKAASSTARASAGLAATTARMGKVGATLTKRVTLPLAALAAVSVDQAAKYQKSLTTIAVVTDQTSKQMQDASRGLEKIATSTGTSLGQLTDGLYTVEKGGFRGAKALAVIKAAAQGAKAENVDLSTATGALTSVMASYGKALSDPVKAENELIKGSGLAKTTMSDFANSLSNVVPVAASLHVSFAEVAAAIATMTQHGETAQHATENLRNLITNLAGQNNVAAGAMNQLGINTVSVSKNLGRRGLTGTLDYVLGRVGKLNHNGLITVDVFKKSALATSSLHKMLATMNPDLRKTSDGLLKGGTSIKDYQKYAKDLGGRAGASALQFLALFKSSRGFSDLIKSGRGNVQTYASALQKMLGGVTGMNTALQLSGESADRFHKNAKAIGKAATATKGDVLGWAQTQGTLSVKLDKAKASLQVMAVELGTALIPAISKLADLGGRVVHWFDGLSGTQKQVLGWSLGVMAALGPVLSIGSRLAIAGRGIGTFVGGVGTKLSLLAGSTADQAARVGVAMRRMGSALAGAGVGYAIGTLTKHSSTAAKAVGALGSAAAGAAIGFGVGGPWGAAIGGAAGLVSNLATNFLGARDATQKETDALDAQRQAAMDLAGVLANTAFNKQAAAVKGSAIAELTKSGAYNNSYSISPTILTDAALGSYGAIQRATNAILRANGDLGKSWNKVSQTSKDAIRSLNQKIFDATERARQAEVDYEHMSQAAGKLGFTHVKLSKEVAQFGTTLDSTTAFGQRNTFVIQQQAAALADLAVKHSTSGAAAIRAAGKYTRQEDALRASAIAAGFNKDQVEKLTEKYQHLPKQVVTELKKIGVTPGDIEGLISKYGHIPKAVLTAIKKKGVTPGDIQAIIDKYNLIPPSKSTTVTTVYRTQHANSANPGTRGDQSVVRPATGGHIMGPGTGTSDSIPARLSNGEFVINARQTKRHLSLLHAINRGSRGFAGGGYAGSAPPITHVGKDWIVNGVRYASERAAQNAQQRAQKATKDHLGTAVGALKSFLSPSNLSSVSTERSQFGTLLGDVRAAGGSNKLINKLKAENRDLEAAINKRVKDTALLQKAQQILSDVSQATKQGFDVTTSGADTNGRVSFGRFRAQQIQEKNIINRWAADLRKIGKVFGGSKAGREMLLNLAQAGPSTFPQVEALAHAGPAALRSIVSTQAQIDRTASSIGGYISTVETGGTIAQHKRTIAHDTKQVEHDAAVMGRALLQAFPQIKWKLEIDSRGIATLVAEGNKRNHRKGSGR